MILLHAAVLTLLLSEDDGAAGMAAFARQSGSRVGCGSVGFTMFEFEDHPTRSRRDIFLQDLSMYIVKFVL